MARRCWRWWRRRTEFQSPSRGGRLCGCTDMVYCHYRLHTFQSPSRGGRLCGGQRGRQGHAGAHVSVPFTRGTPLWLKTVPFLRIDPICFSPLHEGDASVAQAGGEGAGEQRHVSVPFTRGTPLWYVNSPPVFLDHTEGFSPLHEGDASVANRRGRESLQDPGFSPLHEGDASVARRRPRKSRKCIRVSVPFTRGTPLWPSNTSSPARISPSFSPLHEGDASVAVGRSTARIMC